MNKSKNNSLTDHNMPKRTITTFVRKAAKLETEKKSSIFESQLNKVNKENNWLKKPNESWDY